MPDKKKILYDAVSKDYNVGTYDEFVNKLNDPTKRKAFYDGVGAEYDLGSYSDFETKVGGGKKSGHYERFKQWLKNIKYWLTLFPKY